MGKYFLYLCFLGLFLNPKAANAKCVFNGNIDFVQKSFELELKFQEKERIVLRLNFLSPDKFSFSAKLDHFKLVNSYLSTNLTSEGLIIRNKEGDWISLRGSIQTNYSLLNFKPFKEINGYFEFNKSAINIYSLMWENLLISGKINLEEPVRLDLTMDIMDMDINELALLLGINLEDFPLSGLANGRIKIEDIVYAPQIKGELRINNGNISTLKYREILANIDGVYPVLKFVDSNIFGEDGQVYSIMGKFNLKELNNLNSSNHDVKLIPLVSDDFNWEAWTIRRQKLYGRDDLVEFEYQLKEDRPFKMRLREDEEIFSLEHSLRF